MSLILTTISRRGVIHAADSNLSNNQGPAGTGQKVFPIPYLNAALSVAGSYSVAGVPMDRWMSQAIAAYGADAAPTLAGFGENLRTRLEAEMQREEKGGGSLIHLCGYVPDVAGSHPEFYFVRNVTSIDPVTGGYAGFADGFALSEDFWARDYRTADTRNTLASGGQQFYINGYPPGRIGYLALMRHFGEFLHAIWSQPQWSFRPPATLVEDSLLVKLQMDAIGSLFQISDYPAPYIGGNVQIERLTAPNECVTL